MRVLQENVLGIPNGKGGRVVYLDAFRGLAILAMVVDHVTLVTGGPEVIRLTVGRLAMPAFFVLAGTLAGRLRARHGWVLLLGLVLPLVVPWIDGAPNVLVAWVVGCALLAACRWAGQPPWLLAVVGLAMMANGWSAAGPGSYDVAALYGLMGIGAALPRTAYTWAARAPGWVATIGRHPIGWYAGHLLFLQTLLEVSNYGG